MEPVNVAKPRKSTMGDGTTLGYNPKLMDWLRKQDDLQPPDEIIEMLPVTNEGITDNVTQLFNPDPARTQQVEHWERPSIWDNPVFANNKDDKGLRLVVNGGRIAVQDVDFTKYIGFILELPGGDNMHVYLDGATSSSRKTSSMLVKALEPYRKEREFFETIEGPLLVVMYYMKRRGLTVSEIRLIEK